MFSASREVKFAGVSRFSMAEFSDQGGVNLFRQFGDFLRCRLGDMGSSGEVTVHEGWEKERKAPEGSKQCKDKSRDTLANMNARMAKVELAVADKLDQWVELDNRTDALESGQEGLREELIGVVNVIAKSCSSWGQEIKQSLLADMEALRREIATLWGEVANLVSELGEVRGIWALSKMTVASGRVAATSSKLAHSKVDVPKPKSCKRVQSAREIDNFLWGLEQFFHTIGIVDDGDKISHAALYLEDITMVWWRWQHGEIKRGSC